MLLISLLCFVTSFFLAGFLAGKIKIHYHNLYNDVGKPLSYEWYPFWVFQLLGGNRLRLLARSEQLVAIICMTLMSFGLILAAGWVYVFLRH